MTSRVTRMGRVEYNDGGIQQARKWRVNGWSSHNARPEGAGMYYGLQPKHRGLRMCYIGYEMKGRAEYNGGDIQQARQ